MDSSITIQQNGFLERILDFATIQADLHKKFLLDPELKILDISNLNDKSLLNDPSVDKVMSSIRFFKLDKFVFEKDIKISYKLKSVFSALHSVHSTLIFQLVSNGSECSFYVGVKTKENITSKMKVLKGAIEGNFPGTTFSNNGENLKNDEVLSINSEILDFCKEITTVVGIPSIKDKEEEQFIQGIENLILGMNGKPFSALFIAESIKSSEVEFTLDAYEQIYSVFSSQKEFTITDGINSSSSSSSSTSNSLSNSTSESSTEGTNESTSINSSPWIGRKLMNGILGTGSKTASNISKGLEDGIANLAEILDDEIGSKIRIGEFLVGKKSNFHITAPDLKIKTDGNKTKGINSSKSKTISESLSKSDSISESISGGTSTTHQKTFTNKKVSNFLERLDKQIERLEQGKGIGFWNVGAYFVSDVEQNSVIAANIYNGVIKGAESNFESSLVKTFSARNSPEKEKVTQYLKHYELPRLQNFGFLAQAVTTDELTLQMNFPHKSVVGIDVVEVTPFGNNPLKNDTRSIKIGHLFNYDKEFANNIFLNINKFSSHVFVTGSTGSGKSNVTYNLIDKLGEEGIRFLVIEPAKGEYKEEFGSRKDVEVYGTNPNYTQLLKINPFEFPEKIHVYEHIDRFIEILNSCWPMEAAMPNILKEAVEDAYISKGWILEESRCIGEKIDYPLFSDLLVSLEEVIKRSKFSNEVKSNYEGALVSRVRSMTNGLNKLIFTKECISDSDLFDKNVIIDLSRVPSSEGKALFMGLIFMKLNQYRIANKEGSNSKLKHVTILEEAHNLLKRTSSEQSITSGNLAGKSVEMISNAIAEMRTFGEGFIIADQAPGLLDMSVIRNTNTKICLRLPDLDDRKLVGNAMNLSEDQIKELASLETGVAAVYQNDWQEAILCKFDKFESREKAFFFQITEHKANDLKKVIDLLNDKFSGNKDLSEKDYEFLNEIIKLEFLTNHVEKLNFSKTPNFVKNEILKLISKIVLCSISDAKLILKYVLQIYVGKEIGTTELRSFFIRMYNKI
jgi:predicted AAA+ superfamily ATPase